MDEGIFSKVMLASEQKLAEAAQYPNRRYLYETVSNAPKEYCVGVYGLRGIGKTIMLLQQARAAEKALYISADAIYLKDEPLYGMLDHARKKGYRSIFVDEINSKPGWEADLKTFYDEGGARIFFTGSSAIELRKGADLSRRVLLYHMKPLSFREYIIMKRGLAGFSPIPFESLFSADACREAATRHSALSAHLHEFFALGGIFHPGGAGDKEYAYASLSNVLEKIIHHDLAYLREIDVGIENAVLAILKRIALSSSYEVNFSRLSENLSISKPTVIRIVDDLARIGVVMKVPPCFAQVRKEPKLFLAFPFRSFFAEMLGAKPDIGTLREEFFASHVDGICHLKGKRGERTPDFMYKGKKVEVGGAGKGASRQNPDFVLREEVVFGDKSIPLFLAGFNY
ncbi:MAG: AAA family ATPase [Candidatus Micrarchaeota archaeon]